MQGQEALSTETLRSARRICILSAIVIVVKGYMLPLDDLSLYWGWKFEAHLFDVVALAMLLFGIIVFMYNWIGDVYAYKNWYNTREVWSQFQSNMPIDKSWYSGGVFLILRLYENEDQIRAGACLSQLPKDLQERYS